jgi:hypothetical protein
LPPDKIEGKIIRGILRKEIRPEFTAEYTAFAKKSKPLEVNDD